MYDQYLIGYEINWVAIGALVLATTVATVFLLIRRRQNPN